MWCGCCTGSVYEAKNNTERPMIQDVHMYIRKEEGMDHEPSYWCTPENCAECHPTGDRCEECVPGLTKVLGACFQF
jgi:hypothetical protein